MRFRVVYYYGMREYRSDLLENIEACDEFVKDLPFIKKVGNGTYLTLQSAYTLRDGVHIG